MEIHISFRKKHLVFVVGFLALFLGLGFVIGQTATPGVSHNSAEVILPSGGTLASAVGSATICTSANSGDGNCGDSAGGSSIWTADANGYSVVDQRIGIGAFSAYGTRLYVAGAPDVSRSTVEVLSERPVTAYDRGILSLFSGDGINRFYVRTDGATGIGSAGIDSGLMLDVNGKVGATSYCTANGGSCATVQQMINPSSYSVGTGDCQWYKVDRPPVSAGLVSLYFFCPPERPILSGFELNGFGDGTYMREVATDRIGADTADANYRNRKLCCALTVTAS